MPDTNYEEAKRCPRCNEPGMFVSSMPVRTSGVQRGTKLETYECANRRCSYGPSEIPGLGIEQGERWAIQINPDGSIPPRGTRESQRKEWDIERHTTTQERERARDYMAHMLEQQTKGDPR